MPDPRPSAPAWRDQRGQTAAEYMGMLLIVSVIVAALFTAGLGGSISGTVDRLICTIAGGGSCEQRAELPLERCLVSRSEDNANFKLFVGVVEVGKNSILIREDFSDGTSRFTLIDSSEVKGQLFAGAKAKVGDYGLSAAAEAAAGGRLRGARVFEVATDKADEFEESVAAAGSFEGLLRDAAKLNDRTIAGIPTPFGLPNPLGKLDDLALDVLGVDEDDPTVEPSEEYVDVAGIVDGEASAGAGAGIAGNADVAATVNGAAGAKVIHKGKRAGEVELYYSLRGDLGGSLSAGLYGVNLGGDASFVATLVLGKDGEPKTLKLVGAAGYTGGVQLGGGLEGKDAAQAHEQLKSLSLSATAGEGKAVQVGAELDLSDPANRAVALRVLTPNPSVQGAAVPDLLSRLDSHGKLSIDFFNVSKDETEGEIKAGIGIGGGLGGGQSSNDKTATGSFVRMPGGRFQERRCKR